MFWATTPIQRPEPPACHPTFRVLGSRPAGSSNATTGISEAQAQILHFWDPDKVASAMSTETAYEESCHKHTKTSHSVCGPYIALSAASAQIEYAFSKYRDDGYWLENSRNSLAFLVVNNCFPDISLEDLANLELVITMRGWGKNALLLVFENRVLVQGNRVTRERLCEGLFQAIATKVQRIARRRGVYEWRWIDA